MTITNTIQSMLFNQRRWFVPVVISVVLVLVNSYNHLLFHTLSELFAITVAVMIGIVAWYTYAFSHNHYLMYLGIGYFWVGMLDLQHTLGYKGFNIFANAPDDLSIRFWIATRFIEAIVLLTAPLFLARKVDRVGMMSAFALVFVLVSAFVLEGLMPTMYVEGSGLTPIKIYSEYAIIGLLAIAMLVTLRLRNLFDQRVVSMIVLSILFTIAAELSFTLYTSFQDTQLVAGHLFKLLSFWVVFVAIVRTSLKDPYEIMARTTGTYDAIPTPTIVVNRDGIIQQVNREACHAANLPARNLLERQCHEVFHSMRVDKNDCLICKCIASGETLHDYEQQKHDMTWWSFALTPFDSLDNSELMVHVCADISNRKHAEQSLIHQANYDSLTQLPNRALAIDRLQQTIERAKRDDKHVAVMFIDMDNFKNINDTLGHIVGDRVLVAVSNVLAESIHATDTLARWGGDEFIIILGELDTLAQARPVADKILKKLSSPVHTGDHEFIISASIGISGYPDNGEDPSILLSSADAAMYLSKDAGRNTVRFYTADINARVAARLEMESHLRHAIERGEFTMRYQPQVRMRDSKIIGAEALLRWNDPILGSVSPSVFIPLAESTGLVLQISEWVLRKVCADMAAWQKAGHRDLRVSVNISPLQFVSENFIPLLKEVIAENKLRPELLELEITETLLLGDEQRNLELFQQLRALGFNLSLDDFGTGYASVSYLKKFPFNEIKIDRQFVTDADTNDSDARLCHAIIKMAHGLGLSVVAEGVETRGQWDLLLAGEVEIAQGYLYSKPLLEEEFRAFLERKSKGVVTSIQGGRR